METRFARSARRNTMDLLTVTEMVGDTCCCALPICADSNINGMIANPKKLSLLAGITLRRLITPPTSVLEFDDFTIVTLDHFNLVLVRRYRSASRRSFL